MIASATTPLKKLSIASIDLETTGLQPATDRIVQIGMVNPWDEKDSLDVLVNPGMAIPQKSTAIHGISDDMVAGADSIAHLLPRLREVISGKVVLGYNIGFDLAVLDAEAARCGLDWNWESALCVRQLSMVALGEQAAPMMGDLNALAGYYGVATGKRHTALGDALITAEVFRAMLPELESKQITTLADAMRAVSALDDLRMATVRAGWVDVAGLRGAPAGTKPGERIDPYPYRHRIGEIMLRKPEILPASARIREAAAVMKKRKIDCVFVGRDTGSIEGIVSERDIVMTMAIPTKRVKLARDIPIGEVMSAPVITVSRDDFLYVALGRISRLDIRHLGVVDDSGALCGWISSREMVRQRVTAALVMGDAISNADDAGGMADALRDLPSLASSLIADNVESHLIAAVISGEYRRAVTRAAELAEAMMPSAPPRAYAVLVLGSAGRGESLLAADQDHAIVYDDSGGDDATAQAWFEKLGGHISDILDAAGIPYCTGGVMSSNTRWCRPLAGWKEAIAGWVARPDPEALLAVDIFFDFRCVHGDTALAAGLSKAMTAKQTRDAGFLKLLAGNAANAGGGTTMFGGLRAEEGRFDIKKYLLLPLVETLRVLAISRGITARSSAARAAALTKTGNIPPEIPLLVEDIHFALKLVLRQQIRDISAGLAPSTKVEVAQLGKSEIALLKSILGRVGDLDALLQTALFSR